MLSSSGSLVLVPLRHWYCISFLNVLGLLPFYSHLSGLACDVVVFSVTRYVGVSLAFPIHFRLIVFWFSLSHSL